MFLRVLNKDILFSCPWSVIFSVELAFNSVLALRIQQNVQKYTYIVFIRNCFIIGYYKVLSIVPCAIQSILVVHLSYFLKFLSEYS